MEGRGVCARGGWGRPAMAAGLPRGGCGAGRGGRAGTVYWVPARPSRGSDRGQGVMKWMLLPQGIFVGGPVRCRPRAGRGIRPEWG